jgi:hypothetical protein
MDALPDGARQGGAARGSSFAAWRSLALAQVIFQRVHAIMRVTQSKKTINDRVSSMYEM